MFKILKKILSLFYFIIYSLNQLCFHFGLKKVFSSPSYIISIGNLSVGGSGKTPMVELVSQSLYLKKLSPVIISRGYKRRSSNNLMVSDEKEVLSGVDISGDEPYLLAKSLPGIPVWVGKKSQILFSAYNNHRPRSIVLDDGFQSDYIKKNLDILLVDTSVNLKEYKLFPSGRLREPLAAINRANIIVFTKCNFGGKNINKIKKLIFDHLYNKKTLIFTANYVLSLKQYKNNKWLSAQKNFVDPVVAFCGIANSSIFEGEASRISRGSFAFLKFSDHHKYSKLDLASIKQKLDESGSQTLLTTKKDFYKVRGFFKSYNLFVLDVEHHIVNENAFLGEIERRINKYYSS